jgi:hypothetical protein
MAFANYLGSEFHDLLLNAAAIPNIADNAATAPLTNLYASLHTAAPGVGGSQTTNEVAYTSYARVAVPRDGTRWTVADLVATLVGNITFPKATGGTATATHFAIGTDASGAGEVLYFATIKDGADADTSLAISANITPQIDAGATITLS